MVRIAFTNVRLARTFFASIQIDGKRWASREKTCFWGFKNYKGANQPALPRSLISAFVICLLESIISIFATSEISIY